MVKNILFLLDNPYTNDRRVQREAEALVVNGFTVTVLATIKTTLLEEEVRNGVQVYRMFDDSIFDIKNIKAKRRFVEEILSKKFSIDVIHAHDQTMLDIGVRLKKSLKNVKLIYDSHELFSSWPLNLNVHGSFVIHLKSFVVRRLQVLRERHNIKYVDSVITVNDSIASYLLKDFRLRDYPLVLRNIPEKANLCAERQFDLRTKFNIDRGVKILVFIGANVYAKTLNIEQVISEIGNDVNYALIFIVGKNINSIPIEKLVEEMNYTNIYFHDLIPPNEIANYLSSADVGLVPTWNKKDLSYWFALDNKLFEYISANIPVLATAQPEYMAIVEKFNCGVCVNPDEVNAYKNGLKEILDDYEIKKKNSSRANKELNWELEQKKLISFYRKI